MSAMQKNAGCPCLNISVSEPWDICRKLVSFSFSDKLDPLCIVCEDKITADTETKIIALIDEITEELILPKREKEAA